MENPGIQEVAQGLPVHEVYRDLLAQELEPLDDYSARVHMAVRVIERLMWEYDTDHEATDGVLGKVSLAVLNLAAQDQLDHAYRKANLNAATVKSQVRNGILASRALQAEISAYLGLGTVTDVVQFHGELSDMMRLANDLIAGPEVNNPTRPQPQSLLSGVLAERKALSGLQTSGLDADYTPDQMDLLFDVDLLAKLPSGYVLPVNVVGHRADRPMDLAWATNKYVNDIMSRYHGTTNDRQILVITVPTNPEHTDPFSMSVDDLNRLQEKIREFEDRIVRRVTGR